MKKILILISTFFFLVSFQTSKNIDDVISSINAGNSTRLSSYFDNTIEITFPEKSNSYSKNQAEIVIRDFFVLHQVRSFDVLHKGENIGSQYCIGILTTKNGIFRTTVYLKQKGDRQLLQEIRFEIN